MKDALIESYNWYKDRLAQETIKALEKNNIWACYVETAEEARKKVISLIPEGSKVGHGGSLTLQQLGIMEVLRKGNYNFIDRSIPEISEDQKYMLRRESLLADVFLMSTNALTREGQLVNLDGSGNRVAALIFGPPKVIVIAGINKIVANIETAVDRIKNYVAPIHAKRGDRDLPCAKEGKCVDCHAPKRFCNALVIIEHQYLKNKDRIMVIIVGEELGL
jgi:L-lactate utilization protein LutB